MIVFTLLGLGIIEVYSATSLMSHMAYGDSLWFVKRHLAAIVVGLSLGLGCLMVPYPAVRGQARWLFLISLVLLFLAFVWGQEIGGARRWLRLGRLSFQPSEFAQLSVVIYLADLLARTRGKIRQGWQGLWAPLLVSGLVAGVILLQPDLGTAVAIGSIALLLLWMAKARWSDLVCVSVIALVAVGILIAGEEYRRRRIFAFLDPWKDPQGSGYQILQSYFALASGGWLGQGLGGSSQKLFYLPSAHTDFIFAMVGEELGWLGTTAVLALLALLLSCGFRIALSLQNWFSKYLVCGLVGMMGLEAMINIAVVTGLMPTKGLPLPLVSYGGSAMVVNLIACALILHASRHDQRYTLESALGR